MLVEKGRRLGKFLLYTFFGPFEEKEIGEPLKIVKV